jgi:hypothetical protein
MVLCRRIGAGILALAAIAVWLLMAPAKPKAAEVQTPQAVSDQSTAIAKALSDYQQNNLFTTGAPQQAVVNGWAAKDLLTIIAKQQNEALTRPPVIPPLAPTVPNDDRIPALVGLLVLGLALALATAPPSKANESAVVPTDPGKPASTPFLQAFHPGEA